MDVDTSLIHWLGAKEEGKERERERVTELNAVMTSKDKSEYVSPVWFLLGVHSNNCYWILQIVKGVTESV